MSVDLEESNSIGLNFTIMIKKVQHTIFLILVWYCTALVFMSTLITVKQQEEHQKATEDDLHNST